MKKLLIFASLVIAILSFQANAATLTWDTISVGQGTETHDPNIGTQDLALNGQVIGIKNNKSVSDTWKFNLSTDSETDLLVNSHRTSSTWLSSVLLDGTALTGPSNGEWSFTGLLTAGIHTISIAGVTTRGNSGYQIDASIPTPNVPVPAAIWLFGSGLLGLTGLRTRKKQA